MGLANLFDRLLHAPGQKLCWKELTGEHAGDDRPFEFKTNEAYFTIRLREMYVCKARVLWRKLYPMVYSLITQGSEEQTAVVGPGQLKVFSETNLDRMVNLNHRLAGPTVYRGGDLSLLVGLFSVPGNDLAKGLIDVVGQIAAVAGPGFAQLPQIAGMLKKGTEAIVGTEGVRLQLGIRDAFFAESHPLQPGFWVGINAPIDEVEVDRLWVRDGRLCRGIDPPSARPYDYHDYMLIQIAGLTSRNDWPSLPAIMNFEKIFGDLLTESRNTAERKEQLAKKWPHFAKVVWESPELTNADKKVISESVMANLRQRIDEIERGNPFETRGWTLHERRTVDPYTFDFLDVEPV